ncbi:GNAT family N-acetyltransferase [Geodermatophilus sp. CPCC 205506]|uniref:GNAT family N-acetyltransferase n=1 Tax=Geodermatophilus sp. CPCC 205506 TaxID=2936596 RepID=UPI003EEB20EC
MHCSPSGSVATPGNPALGGLDATAWDRLAAEHFYSSADWLTFCAGHGGGISGAVVSSVDGLPSAAVPVWEPTEPPSPLYRWNDVLSGHRLPTLPERGLIVGPRQGYQTHILSASGPVRAEAVAELVSLVQTWPLERCPRGDGSARVAMYVTSADAQALADAGVTHTPVLLEADAWFDLPPGGWDAWLATLPAKRRSNVRNEVGRFQRAGYTVDHLPLAECWAELAPLAASTQAKYGHVAPEAHWRGLLHRHMTGMGRAARVAVCRRRGGDIVGFCLYYIRGNTLFLRWAGFDYDRLDRAAEYFNLVYYSQMARAPELGVRRLHAGVKALEAKVLRGARLRPLWMVDLDPDSGLKGADQAIRQHNRATRERLLAEAGSGSAVDDPGAWLPFA